jgi:hypothetical protein
MKKKAVKRVWKKGSVDEFLSTINVFEIMPGDKPLWVSTPKGMILIRYDLVQDTTEVITKANDDITILTQASR